MVRSASLRPALLTCSWFALLAGLLEAGLALLLHARPGHILNVSEEILWIAPVFDLLLFSTIGLGVYALFRILKRPVDLRLLAGLLAGISLFALLLYVDALSQFASLILSLGVGAEVGRRVQEGGAGFLRLARKTILPLGLAALACGAFGFLKAPIQEAMLIRRLPEGQAGAPNVLLITLDTLRADHMSSYNYARQTTPNLDQVAKEGVLFENAFANASWTLPSHATLFTGEYPDEHHADWQTPLDGRFTTLAEVLQAQGYQTGGFAANTYYLGPVWGMSQGFTRFESYGSSFLDDITRTVLGKKIALTLLPRLGYYDILGRKNAATVNGEFLHWLDGVHGRPFFAFLNYLDLHDPYLAEEPYRTAFSQDVSKGDVINFQFQVPFRRKPVVSPAEVQREINSYDSSLYYLDAQLGQLFADLKQRGLDQNTIVIVTSDHGESFGDHNLFGHGNGLYVDTLHVPLIIRWPGKVPAGARVSQVVGLNRVPATLLDLLGKDPGVFQGTSLAALWSQPGDANPEEEVPVLAELSAGRFEHSFIQYPNSEQGLRSLITSRYQFIETDNGQVELYAWQQDAQEAHNLAGTSEGQAQVSQFKDLLQTMTERKTISVSIR